MQCHLLHLPEHCRQLHCLRRWPLQAESVLPRCLPSGVLCRPDHWVLPVLPPELPELPLLLLLPLLLRVLPVQLLLFCALSTHYFPEPLFPNVLQLPSELSQLYRYLKLHELRQWVLPLQPNLRGGVPPRELSRSDRYHRSVQDLCSPMLYVLKLAELPELCGRLHT